MALEMKAVCEKCGRAFCRTRRGLYMQLRVHILSELCRTDARRLSELRRRTRAPSASGRPTIIDACFGCPPGLSPVVGCIRCVRQLA
jgi:hypothetical protein